jgi:hypothetical protein
MTRRGLQITFVVGIMALGAAPLFGQIGPAGSILIDGAPTVAGVNYNGLYVTISSGPNEGSVVWTRYGISTNEPPYATLAAAGPYGSSTGHIVRLHSSWPGTSRNENVAARSVSVSPNPPLTTWNNFSLPLEIGGVAFTFDSAGGPDPYSEAFPDWESASVKIPLGFALGMAFWAAAVALTIPMKWIKELASAAS